MSFGVVASVAVGLMAVNTYQQSEQARKAADAQERANNQAREDARKAADQADQAANKANRKGPDLAALMAGNAMTKGVGSTMLTGPGGVAPNTLALGRNQLLGA